MPGATPHRSQVPTKDEYVPAELRSQDDFGRSAADSAAWALGGSWWDRCPICKHIGVQTHATRAKDRNLLGSSACLSYGDAGALWWWLRRWWGPAAATGAMIGSVCTPRSSTRS